MLRLLLILSAVSFVCFPYINKAHAAGDAEPIPHLHWHFEGITGTYDKNALQRGFQVYREVCHQGCGTLWGCKDREIEIIRAFSWINY